MLSQKMALMSLVEKDEVLKNFYWKNGYGAFSVNTKGIDRVKDYISKQHEHHTGKSFKEEYLGLLEEHCASFDERYLWG